RAARCRGGEAARLRAHGTPRFRGEPRRGGGLAGAQGRALHPVGRVMGKIAVLPPAVQGQIAAGEVIDRPASVGKELVESALVAFARHATSKLARAEDLPTVATLGFRGEALPSIAAVARVRVVTRRATEAGGVAVEADAGGARSAGAAGAPPGTSVEVRGLFAATPARRKFLRSPATEVGHAVDVLTRLAVASPAAGFRLEHDGREVLAFPPVAGARQRLVQVLGRERAEGLVPVEAAAGGYALTGFLAPPRETLATARLVWTYVAVGGAGSARWVRDRLL